MKLKGKVAVVTGGGRDIGRAVSIKLAREGAKVVVNYFQSAEEGEETLRLIREENGEAISVVGDMTKEEDIIKLVTATQDSFGGQVDVLVNVAGGLFSRRQIQEVDDKYYNQVMNVNFKSVYIVIQAIKPLMGSGGSIVNFSSQAARDGGGPGASLYAASKGAVMAFTRSLAKEFGPEGVRVKSLCPGMIATKFHDDFTKNEVREKVAGGTPLRREGKAEEVADAFVYLASNSSSFITGNNIDINGGLTFS